LLLPCKCSNLFNQIQQVGRDTCAAVVTDCVPTIVYIRIYGIWKVENVVLLKDIAFGRAVDLIHHGFDGVLAELCGERDGGRDGAGAGF
ncbi:MAG: hypothetical protein ABI142_02555, partial [Bryocella sp.]